MKVKMKIIYCKGSQVRAGWCGGRGLMMGITGALWHCPEVTSKAHPRSPQPRPIPPGPRGPCGRGAPRRGQSRPGGRGRLRSGQSPGPRAELLHRAEGPPRAPLPTRPEPAPPGAAAASARGRPRPLRTAPSTGREERVGNRHRALTELPGGSGSGPAPSAGTGPRLAETSLAFPSRTAQPFPTPPGPARPTSCSASVFQIV